MLRKIINIDENKCNGCGLCAVACHEGAIGMVNGKARLLRDDYCDGLGDCLPACPAGAITFMEREAAPYDEEAVKAHLQTQMAAKPSAELVADIKPFSGNIGRSEADDAKDNHVASELTRWPVQLKLAQVTAPYFNNADLLLAADCTAYAYGDFHRYFMKNKITLIGCPKLDSLNYADKLAEILKNNDIKSLTIARMEVPCCSGLEQAAKEALRRSGKRLPLHVAVISTDGRIVGPRQQLIETN